jgi:hypothetical protein
MMQIQKNPADHLVNAYNQMMTDMRNTFAQVDNEVDNEVGTEVNKGVNKQTGKQPDKAEMSLQKALDIARHKAVQQGKVSAEEAIQLSEYIKHDINDAAEFMMESSDEFQDWLSLKIEVIERKIIDTFLVAANNTFIELERLKANGKILNPPMDTDKHK